MGRYYSGDIEGKFWFAVQSSDCADRFGQKGYSPDYLEYHYEDAHIEDITKELKAIEKNIGKKRLKAMDKFFNKRLAYNDEELLEFLHKETGVKPKSKTIRYLLSEYADLKLGRKILDCVEDEGYCSFTAEC